MGDIPGRTDYNSVGDVETLGHYLVSFRTRAAELSDPVGRRVETIMAQHDIDDAREDEYYPNRRASGAFWQVREELGERPLFACGKQLGRDALLSWEPETVHEGLGRFNEAHLDAFSLPVDVEALSTVADSPVGGYTYSWLGPSTVRCGILDSYPHPTSLAAGVVHGVADRLTDPSADPEAVTTEPIGRERAAWELTW